MFTNDFVYLINDLRIESKCRNIRLSLEPCPTRLCARKRNLDLCAPDGQRIKFDAINYERV